MRVIVDHIEREAPHILTFYLRPESAVSYIAGQFVRLTVDHPNPDNRGIWRWLTLSSSPTDNLLSITAKFVLQNGSTFTDALRRAVPGDEFEMEEPKGTFVLPADPRPLIFVVGGIGITPFHSMFRWLKAKGRHRKIKLLYGVNVTEDIIFREMLERLDTIISVNYPSPGREGLQGLLTPGLVLETAQQLGYSARIYLGPGGDG